MNREFLKTAGVPDEAIDKIMAEYGKDLQAEKDKAKATDTRLAEAEQTIETYKTQIAELEKTAGDNADVKKQLDDLKAQIAEEKRLADEKAADEALTNTIRASIPADKKFINEFTEQAMISQIKAELNKTENKGKGISEIFSALTKDKADIFANPNQLNMAGFGGAGAPEVEDSKMRHIMGLPANHKE